MPQATPPHLTSTVVSVLPALGFFKAAELARTVNDSLVSGGHPRVSPKLLARVYVALGFRSCHTSTGTVWRRKRRPRASRIPELSHIVDVALQGVSAFPVGVMAAQINSLLLQANLPQVSARLLAPYYRVAGFRPRHVEMGTFWECWRVS